MDEFRRTEIEVNVALAGALSNRHPRWDARSMLPEKTGVLKSTDNRKRPDILVMEDSRWPVGIETEFMPARTVEKEAEERLRKKVARTGEPIESVIAVRLPIHLATDPEMDVESVTFDYATYSLDADGNTTRYPPSDADVKWISGDLSDLADAVEHLSLSERRLAEGTRLLEETVSATAERINERVPENLIQDISKFLHQSPDTQTLRMAGAIITSAFVFHSAIDGQPDIPRISELLPPNVLTQSKLLTSWTEILKVNYWPIFSIAHGVIQSMPNRNFSKILEPVLEGVEKLASIGATTYHDLCGRMFQTLITDRKFLATFYTLPTSACLLAELAVERLSVDWGNRESIGSLRIGDFACGTGALLSAVQRAIHRRYRRSGGDDRDLHRQMMEQQLVGLDIMPAAAHLTCSMLSSTHPGVGYGRSNIQTMPYGEFDGAVHIGSLDLLGDDRVVGLFDIEAQRQTSSGIETSGNEFTARDGSFDLVIMNPPFTRATANEKPHHGIRIPSFAGLSTSDEEQKLMTQKLSSIPKFAGHGRAGLATNFLDLAHVKLKDNGILALILPLTFANGSTWAKSRKLLLEHYRDVFVVGIASYGNSKQAFSADTSIGECLLLATKGSQNQSVSTWNLSARPQSLFHASLVAKSFDTSRSLNSLNALGVRERDVAIAAIQMVSGVLQLPRQAPRELPLVQLDKVAERGIEHKLINDRKIGSFRELYT